MISKSINKRKIINDPVHGFIRIPSELVYDLLEHPVFQRLRRIKQLGLTHYVYPGATHTRFQHTIGAMHLMSLAIVLLRQKKIDISAEEEEAALIAILLHDIGHGPFSHALESILIKMPHEAISELLMHKLNQEYGGRLSLAIDIFKNKYKKKFLHQLVSSQLDMDRMDYLKRDSFYTGVVEGNIGTDRIIKMLSVVNDNLTVEAKGIYSIEKFLLARRLMYWQVYFHKTVIASEFLLIKTLQRARYLIGEGINLWATPALDYFLRNSFSGTSPDQLKEETIDKFLELDDTDIIVAAKQWAKGQDQILKHLSEGIIHRKLPKVLIRKQKIPENEINSILERIMNKFRVNENELSFLILSDSISNSAYSDKADKINILFGDNQIKDITEVSDILNITYLNDSITKHIFCYPKVF